MARARAPGLRESLPATRRAVRHSRRSPRLRAQHVGRRHAGLPGRDVSLGSLPDAPAPDLADSPGGGEHGNTPDLLPRRHIRRRGQLLSGPCLGVCRTSRRRSGSRRRPAAILHVSSSAAPEPCWRLRHRLRTQRWLPRRQARAECRSATYKRTCSAGTRREERSTTSPPSCKVWRPRGAPVYIQRGAGFGPERNGRPRHQAPVVSSTHLPLPE